MLEGGKGNEKEWRGGLFFRIAGESLVNSLMPEMIYVTDNNPSSSLLE